MDIHHVCATEVSISPMNALAQNNPFFTGIWSYFVVKSKSCLSLYLLSQHNSVNRRKRGFPHRSAESIVLQISLAYFTHQSSSANLSHHTQTTPKVILLAIRYSKDRTEINLTWCIIPQMNNLGTSRIQPDLAPCDYQLLRALKQNLSGNNSRQGPASWSSGQSFWLLIMRSRVRFPVLPWEFFLEGEDTLAAMVWVVSRI
jgi:hypothetical protein